MSNLVTVKNGDFYYRVPMHEFSRYWLPLIVKNLDYIDLPHLPNDIPYVSKMAALKRGKGFKRWYKSMNTKGSGKHATNHDRTR
jgi:hypothetical protein